MGGDTFAPNLKVGDKSGQVFLQEAFFNCWKVICQHTADLEAVLGYQVCCVRAPMRGRLIYCPAEHQRTTPWVHRPSVFARVRLQYQSSPWRNPYVFSPLIRPSLTRVRSFCTPILGLRCRSPDIRPVLSPVLPDAYQVGRKSPRQQERHFSVAK